MSRFLPYSLLLLSALLPQVAHAFSDPALYTEPTLQGGGGGRFFTGSPVDGYSCAVCHRGGAKPRVTVIGLPVQGYEPGVTYQIELQWDQPELSHALTLELVNLNGKRAGEVALPPDAQVEGRGRCDQVEGGALASYLVKTPTRSIVGVTDCGAANLRFSFTAPEDDEIAFAATVVRSDSSGTSEGDGVLELTKTLRRSGRTLSTRGGTACTVRSLGRSDGTRTASVFCAWLVLAGLLRRRRTRRSKAPDLSA